MFILFSLVLWLLAVTIAITIHEFAHAWASDRLGDPTARLMGRLSLNPLDHYDPVGTTFLLVSTVMRAFGIPIIPLGWAKPVEYDPYNLEKPKRDSGLIALAGPVSNLLVAVLASFLLKTFFMELPLPNLALTAIITLNVALAVFNFIPIHPLDGSKILIAILPDDLADEYQVIMRRFGMLILIFFVFPIFGSAPIGNLITPVISTLLHYLLP